MRWARVILAGAMVLIWSVLAAPHALAAPRAQAEPAAPTAVSVERIRTYAVDLNLTRDDVLHVRETIGYDFGTDHRHGIDRIIPVDVSYDGQHRRHFPLSDIRVASPTGAPAGTEIISGSNETIRIGDPANAGVTGLQSYVISYDVKGVVNSFGDHQELYWNAVGNGWSVPIDDSTITVAAPLGLTRVLCYLGTRGSTSNCDAKINPDGAGVFHSGGLQAHQGTTIVAAMTAGTIPEAAPILTRTWSLRRAFSLTEGSVGGFLALLAVLLGATLAAFSRLGGDERYVGLTPGLEPGSGRPAQTGRATWRRRDPIAVQFNRPPGVTPGELGVIISARAENLHVTATIIDLAVRGYLSITQEVKPRTVKGRRLSGDWTLAKLDGPPVKELRGYQARLHSAIFGRGQNVRISALRGTFAKDLTTVKSLLEDDVTERGWFRRPPSQSRLRWSWAGYGAIGGGAVLTVALAIGTQYAWLGVPVVLTGGVVLLLANRVTGRTAKGTAALAQAEGFRLYLEKAEASQIRFEEGQDIFSRYLPYAVVFGVAGRWAAVFAQLARDGVKLPTPDWYLSTNENQDADLNAIYDYVILGEWTNAFTYTTSTAFLASPGAARSWDSSGSSNNGSSGTPGASGMSGFDGGGGYSGGGEGGGGGGSW